MEVPNNHRTEKKERDAGQDYPESGAEIQIVCVFERTLGGGSGWGACHRGRASAASQQPSPMLDVRVCGAGSLQKCVLVKQTYAKRYA